MLELPQNLKDPVKDVAGTANSMVDAYYQAMDLFFGGDAREQLEGNQQQPPVPKPQIQVPTGVPSPSLPPELAGKAAGVAGLSALLAPLQQLLSSVLAFMTGSNANQVLKAATAVAQQGTGDSRKQAQQVAEQMLKAANNLLISQNKAPVTSLAEVPRLQLDALLLQPAPSMPGLTAPIQAGEPPRVAPAGGPVPELPPSDTTWAHALDQLAKALPIVPVVVQPPAETEGPQGLFSNSPDVPLQPALPLHTYMPEAPTLDFKVNPGRSNPLAAANDPLAKLEAAKDLAKDLNNLAAQQDQLGNALSQLAQALGHLKEDNSQSSLKLSLLTLLQALALFNLKADSRLSVDSISPALATSTLARQGIPAATPLAAAMDPASHTDTLTLVRGGTRLNTDFIRGQDAVPEDVQVVTSLSYDGRTYPLAEGGFYLKDNQLTFVTELVPSGETYRATVTRSRVRDQALDTVAALAADIAGPETALGAFPGNLVYAALEEEGYPAGLPALLKLELVDRIARRLGHTGHVLERIKTTLHDLNEPDESLENLADLLLGLDPVLLPYRRVLQAFAALLVDWQGQPDLKRQLKPYESLISTLSLLLVQTVSDEQTTLNYATLADRLKAASLSGLELESLMSLCRAWDLAAQSAPAEAPEGSAPVVGAFLTRLHGLELPAGMSLAGVLTAYRQALQKAGSVISTDLTQASAAAGCLQRALHLLDTALPEETLAARLKVILTAGNGFYDAVANLPNHGAMSRIAEVL